MLLLLYYVYIIVNGIKWHQIARSLAFEALNERPSSLSALSQTVFGRPLDKTWQVSDWEQRPLRQAQLDYAAQDAHVCVRLFDSCLNSLFSIFFLLLNHTSRDF